MRFKKTGLADGDLIDIYVYGYRSFGVSQAEKYYSELNEIFQFLAETPYVCRERTEFIPPVRIFHHGRHLIVYLVNDDHILIVRVLHDSMDIKRHI